MAASCAADENEPMPAVSAAVEPNLRRDPMRPVLSLLIGIVVSAFGLWVVLATDLDIPGVLLIGAGVVVALLGVRTGRSHSAVD
jgi:NO-binding membrane sensor protein with MHYT domain